MPRFRNEQRDSFSPGRLALAAQGFAAGLTDAFEFIPVVISRPVFTMLVFITAHATKIDANRHMMANKPV
jgi:hypothetical protein